MKTANGEEHVDFYVYDSVKQGEQGERFIIFASPEGVKELARYDHLHCLLSQLVAVNKMVCHF